MSGQLPRARPPLPPPLLIEQRCLLHTGCVQHTLSVSNTRFMPLTPPQAGMARVRVSHSCEVCGGAWLTGYTLHPTPYTLHPTPHTLHPTPYTLHPTPHTL